MRSLGLSLLSLSLTGAVVGNAYYQKKQFYPSVVYITKSNPSMAVIYLQFFVIVVMLGKLLSKIFLGTLRAAEYEHLMERFWYALTETCLAFTVFRDDFNPRFVALFTVLLFLKSFHWLAEERVDYMERSPVIGWIFHLRVGSLLSFLGMLDYLMIMHAYTSTISKGPTVQLVFGFEYAILITVVANTTIKYVLHAAEMRADAPWENKAVFLLYTELVIGLIRVILYLLFVIIMAKIYALPMFVFRPMFYTMRNFKKALNDVIMSRRAIRNMNTLYPDATPEELTSSDNICIICREDMISSSKKLPCGHIFHTACLRSWFQRQQTCPTCRLNILRTPHSTSTARNEAGNAAQMPAPPAGNDTPVGNNLPNQSQQTVFNNNNNNNNANNNNMAGGENPFANLFAQNVLNPPSFIAGTAAGGLSTTAPLIPPFPFMAPQYAIPPPPMPPNLEQLTDDEVRALEGTERRHVEERLKLLRNIQLMLDASVLLMNQYSAITARLPQIPTTVPPQTNSTEGTTTAASTSSAHVEVDKEFSPTRNPDEASDSNSSLKINSQQKSKENEIFIEDLGSEENTDINPSISTAISKEIKNISILTDIPTTSTVNVKSSSNDNNHSESAELSEIRRRRLEKFLQSEKTDSTD